MAITEPGGGANAEDPTQHGRSIRTIAKLDGNEWVINGHKIWPSSASVSDLTYLTVCTTDLESGDEGIALIHVPPESKGLSFSKPLEKMRMCWTDINAEIFYDDVRVPKENRLRGPAEDAKLLHDIVGIGRLGTCQYAVGAAQACFETVVEYTTNREIAGRPVRSRSLHAAIIGEMAQRIDCTRAFYQHIGYAKARPVRPARGARYALKEFRGPELCLRYGHLGGEQVNGIDGIIRLLLRIRDREVLPGCENTATVAWRAATPQLGYSARLLLFWMVAVVLFTF